MARFRLGRRILEKLSGRVAGQVDIDIDLDGDGKPDSLALDRLQDAAVKLAKNIKNGGKATITITIDLSKKD